MYISIESNVSGKLFLLFMPCLPDGPFSLPYVNNQNPVRPVVAKCNLAVLLSLKNASGLVVQKGNMC